MIVKVILGTVLVGALLFVFRLYSFGKQSKTMSPKLGLVDGQLHVCSSKPNCVSTSSAPDDKGHFVAPIEAVENPIQKIKKSCDEMGFKLIEESDTYLRFESESSLFGFIDDIEFAYTDGILQMRSASRVGHSDMGANRKRLEKILAKL